VSLTPGGKTYLSPSINMSDLLQQSSSASAADSYGAYSASCLGGSSANSSMPFVLPDDDEEKKNSGGGYNPPDGNLAEQYDLSRHLDSDRTTFGDGSRETVIKAPAKTSAAVASSASSLSSSQDAPALSSSRAVFASSAGNSLSANRANASSTEKVSETGYIKSAGNASCADASKDTVSHLFDSKQLAYALTANGTAIADTNPEMTRTNNTVRIQTGTGTGLVGTISVIRSGDSGNATQDKRDNEKRDARQNEDYITSSAGAMSVVDESGTSATPTGDAVQMPRMQQISEAILEQMERMSADTANSSVNLKLDMADGSKLGLRLRWKGNRVTASFDSDSTSLRGEISNGWASLALNVGNTGMQLEPPAFTGNTNSGYYA
jgi:hypothetical protein